VAESSHAVFLSYASQDAEAAQKICEALRSAGVEVWFDQSALRGGDVWDQTIRKQIKACVLFIPVLSKHTHDRVEGYFRLEWKLAIDRSHLIAPDQTFLLPVAIDNTREDDERVPDKFRDVHWTRLPGGETPPTFVERVRRLVSPEPSQDPTKSPGPIPIVTRQTQATRQQTSVTWWPKRALPGIVAVVVGGALAYFAIDKYWISKHAASPPMPTAVPASAAVAGFTPPSHSIAVLPLANESGDENQQYFSDGLSEDLITALSQFPGLKVIGRHSSFQFRNSQDDSKTIGARLGVAHLLEGSVRRAGDVVRVSAELINTTDGSTVWSERYDRPYRDLFALQDDITRAVAGALKARLMPSENATAQSLRPPSGNLDAYNALILGMFYEARLTETDYHKAIEQFTKATRLDPRYAVAWSSLSDAWRNLAYVFLAGAPAQEAYAQARAAADTAMALAPDLAAAHIARGLLLLDVDFDWSGSEREFRRAEELAPNDAVPKFIHGELLAMNGQLEPAIALSQQGFKLDPLRAPSYYWLGTYLAALDRLPEAEAALRKAIELQPQAVAFHHELAALAVQRGDARAAMAAALGEPPGAEREVALALARQIGSDRRAADLALRTLIDRYAASQPYAIAQIYGLRNEPDKTFEWLDRAWTARDSGMQYLLIDPFIRRYRHDPRFAALCRKVNLPVPGEAAGT
jgi:TolB-like protein/Tfp pilus assembly protein PilF